MIIHEYNGIINLRGNTQESTHDRLLRASGTRLATTAAKRRGMLPSMTAFETVMVVLGVISLLISFGALLVALLNFLDKRKSKHKK